MALQAYFVPNNSGANICFDCQNACGRCNWSRSFEPVPGWTAEKKSIYNGKDSYGNKKWNETFHITACPEFIPDEQRQTVRGEFDDEQFAALLKQMKIRGQW